MNGYIDYAVQQVINLCNIPSPTGFTKRVQNYLVEEFVNLGYKPVLTNKGSVLVDLGGNGDVLVLAAHVDTLGAMVRAIKDNGRIRISKIGGYPGNYIETENCIVHTRTGKEYSGTIQLVNPAVHVNKDVSDTKRDDSNMEVVLDEKVKSKEDVLKLEINTGDFISFDPRTVYTASGFIKSRHLDDKASAGVLIALAKYIKDTAPQLHRKVYLLFTTYEEVGHGGCSGLPDNVKEMISVDMGAVGDDLQADEFKVSICAKDSQGPYDYDITTRLIELAKKNNLNYAVDIYPYYGSDVDAALSAGYDLKHGLIGPGVSASHGYERTHRDGIGNTLSLLKEYVESP
ncbi:M42 family metallopeptidase [Clostridium thermosuccinogenes]|uniref:M42 family metallopeptidase n=1 Tax=Clostridium thermosuccinogenes TaxID=84032 RepID=UPI000CCC7468|nr:M42 family metallopeptidase [Pseudoclostridium thermosuccinogenes]PNT91016.1 peptidase M42 [Pseudoclostridium thermosuccinogenes]